MGVPSRGVPFLGPMSSGPRSSTRKIKYRLLPRAITAFPDEYESLQAIFQKCLLRGSSERKPKRDLEPVTPPLVAVQSSKVIRSTSHLLLSLALESAIGHGGRVRRDAAEAGVREQGSGAREAGNAKPRQATPKQLTLELSTLGFQGICRCFSKSGDPRACPPPHPPPPTKIKIRVPLLGRGPLKEMRTLFRVLRKAEVVARASHPSAE